MAKSPVFLHLTCSGTSRIWCKLEGLNLDVEILLDHHLLVVRHILISGGQQALAKPVHSHEAKSFTTLTWAYEARGR